MLHALGKKLRRFKPQSASFRNVLKLAGGTAGSQVITVAAAPILTRLYGPESFGVLATFASILALLNVVSSLRYELAIAVPEDDDEAIALVWLCFVLVAISTALTALGVALLGNQLVGFLHQQALKPLLWLLPVGVLLTGIYQPLSYWAIRHKQFGLLAQTKFHQSIFGLLTKLSAAPLGTIGLLLGQIVSQSAGVTSIFIESREALLGGPKTPSVFLLQVLQRYKNLGIYSSPAGMINMLGSQVPTLIFASAFGAGDLGKLAIAQSLLVLPVGLIGSSVSKVFLGQASSHWRLGTLDKYIKKAGTYLIVAGILVALFMSLVVAPIAPIILGIQWESLRIIIPMLSPLLIGQLTASTLSMAFIVAENNRLELMSQLLQAILRLSCLGLSVFAGVSFSFSVLAFSVGSLLGYTCYALLLFNSLKNQQNKFMQQLKE